MPIQGKILIVLLSVFCGFAEAEPRSCLSPDIKQRIRKKMTDPSPFAGCQHAYKAATQTCSQLIRWNSMDLGTLTHVKTVQERRLSSCQNKVFAAKQSCASDRVIMGVLRAEFNDVLKCGDDSVAAINGRIMKDAQQSRRPAHNPDFDFQPEDAVTDGEMDSQEPTVAGQPYLEESDLPN